MKNKFEKISEILFVSPQFILYLLFTIIPFLMIIPFMFTNMVSVDSNTYNFIGFGNFKEIFGPIYLPNFSEVVSRTALFTFFNYLTVFIFGLTLALILYEKVIRAQKAFTIVIYLPYVIAGLAAGMFLPLLFHPDTGSLNLLLEKIGLIDDPIDIKTNLATMITLPILVGWRYAGYNMAIFLVGLSSIPRETIEAAEIDGASYFQRLIHVYLPQMVPFIMLATISCLIGSFGIFDEAVGMGGLAGNRNSELFALYLYRLGVASQVSKIGTFSIGMAASFIVNIPLAAIAISLLRWQRRIQY